jgi:ribonuclease-3
VAHALFVSLSDAKEGELSQLRRALVSGECCRMMSEVLELQKLVLTGKGEWQSIEKMGQWQNGPQGDLIESVIGSIYLEGGIQLATSAWLNMWSKISELMGISFLQYARNHYLDAKSSLQQLSLKKFKSVPQYDFDEKNNLFTATISIEGQALASASAATKKAAQQAAAQVAIATIEKNMTGN